MAAAPSGDDYRELLESARTAGFRRVTTFLEPDPEERVRAAPLEVSRVTAETDAGRRVELVADRRVRSPSRSAAEMLDRLLQLAPRAAATARARQVRFTIDATRGRVRVDPLG